MYICICIYDYDYDYPKRKSASQLERGALKALAAKRSTGRD